jgi:hypothetical protein
MKKYVVYNDVDMVYVPCDDMEQVNEYIRKHGGFNMSHEERKLRFVIYKKL